MLGVWHKGGFPKGWFWRMFPRNEGTFGRSPRTKTGTRVHSDVPPERKPERVYIRQNHPFTKPPFCLPVTYRFSAYSFNPWPRSPTLRAGYPAKYFTMFLGFRGHRAFLKGGDLNPGERHSRDTRDDGTVTLCTLRAATVLSRDCRADFGRPLTVGDAREQF